MTDFKARPTIYKGIKMRSRLEAGFAAWLDERKLQWEYEPCAYASPAGQYLPDFRVDGIKVSGEARRVYVEVKPTFPADEYALARKMMVIWESEPDAFLTMAFPDRWPSGLAAVFRMAPAEHETWGPVVLLPLVHWSLQGDITAIERTPMPVRLPWSAGYWEVQ